MLAADLDSGNTLRSAKRNGNESPHSDRISAMVMIQTIVLILLPKIVAVQGFWVFLFWNSFIVPLPSVLNSKLRLSVRPFPDI